MKNKSGIFPTEYKCLVLMPDEEEMTKGGIVIPKSSQEKERRAAEVGILIDRSPDAFSWDNNGTKWGRIPQIGDKVLFDRYAGSYQTGIDGKEYRLINDKEIGAIVSNEYGN